MSTSPTALSFNDLFQQRGGPDMIFHVDISSLHGQRVALMGWLLPVSSERHQHSHVSVTSAGEVAPEGFMLTDEPGVCPDCSPLPVASVFMSSLANLPPAAERYTDAVTVVGTLSVGLQIDRHRRATMLRLEQAEVVS